MSIILNKSGGIITFFMLIPLTLTLADPAPNATQSVSSASGAATTPTPHLTLGSSFFPAPSYPAAARRDKKQGTVVIHIVFDALGNISSAEVVTSSGTPILDSNTKNWVLRYWHNPKYAGMNFTVPVEYELDYDPNSPPTPIPAPPTLSTTPTKSPSPSPLPLASKPPSVPTQVPNSSQQPD